MVHESEDNGETYSGSGREVLHLEWRLVVVGWSKRVVVLIFRSAVPLFGLAPMYRGNAKVSKASESL
jgi:hypothetical protein